MPTMRMLIYASSSDDRWFLCRGEDVADVYVVHEPNAPSGGRSERVALGAFLARGVDSPEQRVLLGMIGAMVGSTHAASTAPTAGPEPGAAGAEPTPGEASDGT